MAESVWSQRLYRAIYGGQPLDILLTTDDIGRTLVKHEFPNIEGALVRDMGGKPRTTQARIIFFEYARSLTESTTIKRFLRRDTVFSEDHIDRFKLFVDFANNPEPLKFVHPLTGAYPAYVEDLTFELNADTVDTIIVDCTFVEAGIDPVFITNRNAKGSDRARNRTRVQASKTAKTLEEDGVPSTVPGDVSDEVTSWTDGLLTMTDGVPRVKSPREVIQRASQLSSRMSSEVKRLGLSDSNALYMSYREMMLLHRDLRNAVESFQGNDEQLTIINVNVGQPLRTIATELYGAEEVEDRMREMVDLNDIDDPSYIEAGSKLQAFVPRLPRGLTRAGR